jgi:hypothetical protein
MIPKKKELLQFKNAYGTSLVLWMSGIASGEVELPGSPEELRSIIKEKTVG